MKVKIIKTGKIEEHNSGYAVRLIEQGKAVPAEDKPEPVKPEPVKNTQDSPETDKSAKPGKKK
ncbi:MAG: hypothetical protein IKN04_08930 [Clostridia bacterium]|nr:hypothetical protein [Clostridia bacterium]